MGLLIVLVAYLLGSISSAVLVCHALRLPDPRTQGSGNPGATNVLRHGGKKAAILTLFFDVMKGVIAVLLAKALVGSPIIIALAAVAAFLGHLYPVFFGFRGGKGVATAFGVLVALAWPVGVLLLLTWLLLAFSFRYSSLSALGAATLAPVYMYIFTHSPIYILATLVMSVLLIWRHRSNIANLRSGKEDKIKLRSSS